MTRSAEFEAALAQCASEPIHIPGAIQDFGILLCLDESLERVVQVSANIEAHVGISVETCLAQPATALLGKALVSRLSRALSREDQTPGAVPATLTTVTGKLRVQVTAYRGDGCVVVELEPIIVATRQRWLSVVNNWLGRLVSTRSEQQLLSHLVESVRALTGYDRVLVYRFDRDYNGTVIAESRAPSMGSFLDHHFPASDIPPQARAMYERNPIRLIVDSAAEPIQLVPRLHPDTGAPADLSRGILRAVSPVHMQYLQNMGVASAMSIAIFSDTRLWGLVSCHSARPKVLPLSAREAAATLTQVASQRLFLLIARADARYRDRVQVYRERLSNSLQLGVAPAELLQQQAHEWLELLEAAGVALLCYDTVHCVGRAPETDVLQALTQWLSQTTVTGPWLTRSLSESGFPEAGDLNGTYGLLAIPMVLDIGERGWLLFFRPEQVEHIDWGGEPDDSQVMLEGERRLYPRHSFATWREVVRGKSARWRAAEVAAARDLAEDLSVAASAHEIVRLNEILQKEQSALAEANRHLQHLARTDSLTGSWNRQRMEEMIDAAMANGERYHQPFSILLFDLDLFKEINDTHGHNAGDHVLQTLANNTRQGLRQTDELARWGGEEFVVLMCNTEAAGAAAFAERLLQEVASTDFGLGAPVTLSIGVAQWYPGADRAQLLAQADQAMYNAKKSGRNRVCVHDR